MSPTNILCEHPTIIRNPNLRILLLTHRHYVHNGVECVIPDSLYSEMSLYDICPRTFSPRRMGITVDNINDSYVIDPSTGECFPMYILVPCGKCTCCKHRKSKEWSFRAICESQYSTNIPYFLTLTYDNAHCPSCGVNKDDVQRFLKRLRTNLTRAGYEHNLRYFACAEYGKKTHRPHYHMILWNFPHMENFYRECKFIESAWQNGFILCKPCNYGSVGYVMKYMSKDQYIPDGMNKGFFLSSRRNGGIGSAYAESLKDYYRAHPEVTDISVTDKFSGETFTSHLPAYYVRKFFPYMSLLVPKKVRDAFDSAIYSIHVRSFIIENYGVSTDDPDYSADEAMLISKYPYIPVIRPRFCPSALGRLLDSYKYNDDYNCSCFGVSDLYSEMNALYNESIRTLRTFSIDAELIALVIECRAKRRAMLDVLFRDAPDVNVDDVVLLLKESNYKSSLREIL